MHGGHDREAEAEILAVRLHGEGDPRPARPAERLASELGAAFIAIPDAGHLPWVEQPERVAAALNSFLDGLPVETS